jgi:hypothetical protein
MSADTIIPSAVALLWAVVVVVTYRKTQNNTWRGLNASIFALTMGNAAISYIWGGKWTGSLAFAILGIAELLRLRRLTIQELSRATLSWKSIVFTLLWSGYFLAAAILPVRWVRSHVPHSGWLPAGFAVEILAFGMPIAVAIWWFIFRPTAARAVVGKLERLKRGALLFALAFVPAFAVVAVPALCIGLLPKPMNGIVTWSWVGVVFAILFGVLAWAKYYWQPRHPESTLASYARARRMQLDQLHQPSDQQA